MCDGVTQRRPGMELSLFSRDVIAMATAVALTHDVFDGALMLGVCDKIVPGLLHRRAAVRPPAGDLRAGRPDDLGRLQHREGAHPRPLRRGQGRTARSCSTSEMKAYHGPGTCTFYGTANSNQMLMEMMGLHLPGAAFVHPNTPLRDALTAARRRSGRWRSGAGTNAYTPMSAVVDEKSIVNALVGLMATGGSTNHTLHLVAMARAAGDRHRLGGLRRPLARHAADRARLSERRGGRERTSTPPAAWPSWCASCWTPACCTRTCVTVAGEGLRLYQREPFLRGRRAGLARGRGQEPGDPTSCVPPTIRSTPRAASAC